MPVTWDEKVEKWQRLAFWGIMEGSNSFWKTKTILPVHVALLKTYPGTFSRFGKVRLRIRQNSTCHVLLGCLKVTEFFIICNNSTKYEQYSWISSVTSVVLMQRKSNIDDQFFGTIYNI